MQKWLLEKTVQWLVANLTAELLAEWADKTKVLFYPWMRQCAGDVVAALKAKAKESDNTLDDQLVEAFEEYLEALLPDNPKLL